MSLYNDLGVESDADAAAIKKAYRSGAQRNHPDKGGDPAKFHAIQHAYEVLSDAERRDRYDASGEDAPIPNMRQRAQSIVSSLVIQCVEQLDVRHADMVKAMIQRVTEHKKSLIKSMPGIQQKIDLRTEAKKRLQRKDGGQNFLAAAIDDDIAGHARRLASIDDEVALSDEVLAMLGEYQYQVDQRSEEPSVHPMQEFASLFGSRFR